MRPLLLLLPLLSGCLVTDEMVARLFDHDRDGFVTSVVRGPDCDDTNPEVHPDAAEVCGNGLDDDCAGGIDDVGVGSLPWSPDADQDGYGDHAISIEACAGAPGWVHDAADCDDHDRHVYPDSPEDCTNERDDNCNGEVDETEFPTRWYVDADGDDYGTDVGSFEESCSPIDGHVDRAGDCNDADASVNPSVEERPYDGVDNNCDPVDASVEFDIDGDGYRVDPAHAFPPVTADPYAPLGQLDCDDRDPEVHPNRIDAPYDGVDEDCDGADDYDADGDGHRSADFGGDDCADQDVWRHPGRVEVCYDGVDQNCEADDEYDCDGDGRSARAHGGTDCDDADPDVWSLCETCKDRDEDGWWSGCDGYTQRQGPDCDDEDIQNWQRCATCVDADLDDAWVGCDAYLTHFEDCDDGNARVQRLCHLCRDDDGDGRWNGCTAPDEDCDDAIGNAWSACATCVDADGDGVGVGDCDLELQDCDDTDPDVSSSCGLCVDADGDGARTGCDRHLRSPYDCDDGDPAVGGHVFEVMGDGLDQDCNGRDLTVDETSGLFVTVDGQDQAACGTRATPCATPAYAARMAQRLSKVLFVGSGTYPGFETWVSVYGGFDASSWQQDLDAHPTFIVGADDAAVRTWGAALVLSGLSLDSGAGAAACLDGQSQWLRVEDLDAHSAGAGEVCRVVSANGRVLELERVRLEGCEGTRESTGVRFDGGPGSARASILDGFISVTGAQDTEETSGLLSIDANVELGNVEVTARRGKRLVGISHWGENLTLMHSVVKVRAEDVNSKTEGIIQISENGGAQILSSRVAVSGKTGAAAILYSGASAVHGSHLESLQAGSSTALQYGGTAIVDVTGSTLVARGGASALALDGGAGELRVYSTLLIGDTAGVTGTASMQSCHIDSPCVVSVLGTCVAVDDVATEECEWSGCISALGIHVGDPALDFGSAWGVRPQPGSPLVDSGVAPPLNIDWSEDVEGHPRPYGRAWDIGAVELQPKSK